jgi:hypothetical protein
MSRFGPVTQAWCVHRPIQTTLVPGSGLLDPYRDEAWAWRSTNRITVRTGFPVAPLGQ